MLFTKRNENWAWSQVTREQHILGNSSRRTSSFSEFFAPRVGILNKVLYGEASPRGPTPYYPFTHYFWRKRYPFHISSICIIASVELSILFNCCDECTVFEIWIGSLNDLITWSTYGKHENSSLFSLRASSPFGDIVKSRRARRTREETRKQGVGERIPRPLTWDQALFSFHFSR